MPIKDEKQFQVTKDWVAKFEETLKLGPDPALDPELAALEMEAIKSELEELRADLLEYESRQKEKA